MDDLWVVLGDYVGDFCFIGVFDSKSRAERASAGWLELALVDAIANHGTEVALDTHIRHIRLNDAIPYNKKGDSGGTSK